MLVNRSDFSAFVCFMLALICIDLQAQPLSKQHERLLQPHVISYFHFSYNLSLTENLTNLSIEADLTADQEKIEFIGYDFYDTHLTILSPINNGNSTFDLKPKIGISNLKNGQVKVVFQGEIVNTFNLYELEVALLETLKLAYNEEEALNQARFLIDWDSFETVEMKKEIFQKTVNSYINFMEIVSKSKLNKCIRKLDPKEINLLKSNFELVMEIGIWSDYFNSGISISDIDLMDDQMELYEYDELTNKSKY